MEGVSPMHFTDFHILSHIILSLPPSLSHCWLRFLHVLDLDVQAKETLSLAAAVASFLPCLFLQSQSLSLFQSHSLTFSLSLTCTNIFSHVFSSTVRTTIPIPSLARGSRGFGSKWADWKEWRKLTHIKASKTFLPSAEGRIIIKLMERNRRKPSTLRFSKDQRTTNTLVVSFKKEILKDYWLSHLSLKTLFVNQFRVPFVGKCWRRRKWWFRFFVVGDRLLFARIGHNLIFQESLSSLLFEYSYNAASLLITFKK